MPHGVDAPVHWVEPALANAARNSLLRETAIAQLRSRDHAPLARDPPCDLDIRPSVDLVPIGGTNSTVGVHGPSVAGLVLRHNAPALRLSLNSAAAGLPAPASPCAPPGSAPPRGAAPPGRPTRRGPGARPSHAVRRP